MAAVTKPTIANPEIELDASEIEGLSNNDAVSTWEDQTTNGNNATSTGNDRPSYLTNGWSTGIPAVQFLDTGTLPDKEETMIYDDTVWINTDLTLFAVVHVIDLTEACAIMGQDPASSEFRQVSLGVQNDGAVFFGFGQIFEGNTGNILSDTGLVTTNDKIVLSVRHTGGSAGVSPEGTLLRLNGVEVAADASLTSHKTANNPPGSRGVIGLQRLHNDVGGNYGKDRRIPWISGYSTAASNADMVQMECYLGRIYGVAVEGCPPPDTVRATVLLDRTVTTDLELNKTISTRVQLEGTITEDVDA